MRQLSPILTSLILCTTVWLAGCNTSTIDLDRRADYSSASSGKSLVVPPKISRYTSINDTMRVGSGSAENAPVVNPNVPSASLMGEGLKRWIRIEAPADAVWVQLEDFWASQGFSVKSSQPGIGIMETDWFEHNDKGKGVLGDLLASLQSAPYRDRFRTRVDGSSGVTDIFITHYGQKSSGGTYGWVDSGNETELEIEMLRKMMVYLGYGEAAAGQILANAKVGENVDPIIAQKATLDGEPVLAIAEPYKNAWRTVGFAMEGLGYDFVQKDYDQGYYIARYTPRKFFDRIASAPRAYLVSLVDRGSETAVQVRSPEGNALGAGESRRFLNDLLEIINP